MPPRSIGRLLAQEHPSRTGFCTWCQQPVQKPRRTWCSDECVEEYQIRANPQVVRQKLVARDKEVCGVCGLDCRWLANLMERLKRLGPVHCEESARLLRWSVIESKPRTPIEPSATLSPEIAAFLSEDHSERQCYIGQDRRGYSVFLTCRGWGPVSSRYAPDGRFVDLPESEKPYYSWREWFGREALGLSPADTMRLSFWEADHIVPVAEDGWRLGLENFQTVCIFCHRRKSTHDVRRIRARRA